MSHSNRATFTFRLEICTFHRAANITVVSVGKLPLTPSQAPLRS